MLHLAEMQDYSLPNVGNQEKNGTNRFKLATFNTRGLTKQVKQDQLSRDMKRYGVDIACLQETKVTEQMDQDVNNYRLICTETNSRHYGNGFIVSPRWKHHIHRYWRVTDRISVLQMKTEKSKMKMNSENNYVARAIGDC
jgi:exonuclease III